jgi:hypothetical protein
MGYFFRARGSMLVGAMSSASSIAFLLIGWDQGKKLNIPRYTVDISTNGRYPGVLGGLLSGKLFLSTLGNPSASELGTITAVVGKRIIQ